MSIARISPKYQLVIPKEAREKAHLRKGQDVAVLVKGQIITLVPVRPLKHLKGFAKGMSREGIREKKDRI